MTYYTINAQDLLTLAFLLFLFLAGVVGLAILWANRNRK